MTAVYRDYCNKCDQLNALKHRLQSDGLCIKPDVFTVDQLGFSCAKFKTGYKAVTKNGSSKKDQVHFRQGTWIKDRHPLNTDPNDCGTGLYFVTDTKNLQYWCRRLEYTHYVKVIVPKPYLEAQANNRGKWKCQALFVASDPEPISSFKPKSFDVVEAELTKNIEELYRTYGDEDKDVNALTLKLFNHRLEWFIPIKYLVKWISNGLSEFEYDEAERRLKLRCPYMFDTLEDVVRQPQKLVYRVGMYHPKCKELLTGIMSEYKPTKRQLLFEFILDNNHKYFYKYLTEADTDLYIRQHAHSRTQFKKIRNTFFELVNPIPAYMTGAWAKEYFKTRR